jgi:hypothetical protein
MQEKLGDDLMIFRFLNPKSVYYQIPRKIQIPNPKKDSGIKKRINDKSTLILKANKMSVLILNPLIGNIEILKSSRR